MLISLPKRDEIYFKPLGKENVKFEKKFENRRKRYQLKEHAEASNPYPKTSCYHYRRVLEKLMKEIHCDYFKIKVNKLTLTIKTVNEEVDIYTCWQSKPIARAVAVVTLMVIREDR